MMQLLIKFFPFLAGKFSQGEPGQPAAPRHNYIYMKRVMFAFAVLFALWALFSPKTLAAQLWQAEALVPAWFYNMLAAVFAGVWM